MAAGVRLEETDNNVSQAVDGVQRGAATVGGVDAGEECSWWLKLSNKLTIFRYNAYLQCSVTYIATIN